MVKYHEMLIDKNEMVQKHKTEHKTLIYKFARPNQCEK